MPVPTLPQHRCELLRADTEHSVWGCKWCGYRVAINRFFSFTIYCAGKRAVHFGSEDGHILPAHTESTYA